MMSCRSRFKKSNVKHSAERKSDIQRNTWSSCSLSLTLKRLCALISLIIVIICSEHYGPSLLSEGSFEANQQTMLKKNISKFPGRGRNTFSIIPGPRRISRSILCLRSIDKDSAAPQFMFRYVMPGIFQKYFQKFILEQNIPKFSLKMTLNILAEKWERRRGLKTNLSD